MTKFALYVLFGGFAFTGLSACNDAGFALAPKGAALSQIDPTASGPAGGCTAGTTKKNLRTLFMVDNSGSTNTTDPQKAYRVQTIQEFIHDYGGNTNLSYSFGYFSDATANMYDMITNKFIAHLATNAVGNSTELSAALLSYEAITASGYTPYKAAFDSLAGTVTADENAGNKQDYVVVFMSDGQPTDISGSANLIGLVNNLKTAAQANGSGLTLSTVYFGAAGDSTSIGNLQVMANAGNGQFVDTNKLAAGGLVINDIINLPGNCK